MKKVFVLWFVVLLVGVMIGGVSGECQYKENIYSSEEKIVFYEDGLD